MANEKDKEKEVKKPAPADNSFAPGSKIVVEPEVVHLYSRNHSYWISTKKVIERKLVGSNNDVVTETTQEGEHIQFAKCRAQITKARFDEMKAGTKFGYWGNVDYVDAKTLYLWVIEDDPRGDVFIRHMHNSLVIADVIPKEDKLYDTGRFHLHVLEELERVCGIPSRKRAPAAVAAGVAEDA